MCSVHVGAPGEAWVPPAGEWGEAGVGKEKYLWQKRREASGGARGRPRRRARAWEPVGVRRMGLCRPREGIHVCFLKAREAFRDFPARVTSSL